VTPLLDQAVFVRDAVLGFIVFRIVAGIVLAGGCALPEALIPASVAELARSARRPARRAERMMLRGAQGRLVLRVVEFGIDARDVLTEWRWCGSEVGEAGSESQIVEFCPRVCQNCSHGGLNRTL
jgi:hypothetical protein